MFAQKFLCSQAPCPFVSFNYGSLSCRYCSIFDRMPNCIYMRQGFRYTIHMLGTKPVSKSILKSCLHVNIAEETIIYVKLVDYLRFFEFYTLSYIWNIMAYSEVTDTCSRVKFFNPVKVIYLKQISRKSHARKRFVMI